MKKNQNGFHKKIIALLLCCFYFVSAAQTVISEEEYFQAPEEAFAAELPEAESGIALLSEMETEAPASEIATLEPTEFQTEEPQVLLPTNAPFDDTETATPTDEAETIEPTAVSTEETETIEPTAAPTEETETIEPTAAPTEETETAEPTAAPTENIVDAEETLPPQDVVVDIPLTLYEQLMAGTSCQEIYERIADDANYDEASSLSIEQVHAIREKAQSLEDDGYQEILLETLDQLLKYLGEDNDSEYGTDIEADINISNYSSVVKVLWDTTTNKTTSATSAGGTGVDSVTLNSISVTYGNSANTSAWSTNTTLASYFPNAKANSMVDSTLSITASAGYYVTSVIVACAPYANKTQLTPFKCSTWSEGKEFIQEFNLTESTYANGKYTLSFDINSRYFSHDSKDTKYYFILIQVAAVPTPLYVEYNYGNVEDFLTVDSDSAFYNPTWTVVASGNNYGSGSMYANGVLTSDTQFAYQYPSNDTSAIASWTHTANSVSDAALAEAAAAGYSFAGWSVTWYNSCSVSNTQNSCNDSYTMSFSNTYMTGSYSPGDAVQLPTNVRLVAQWKPITLKVTKTVSGLAGIAEYASKSNTYTLLLQNLQSGEYVQLQSKDYAITGDGTLSYTFAASGADVTQVITPGTYKVVETGNYDLTGSSENAYCTTTYDPQTVEVLADGTVRELKVLNTYSSTPAAYTLTVQKKVSGNMASENDSFAFTVKVGESTESFELKHGETQTFDVPVGASVTITENSGAYQYSFDRDESTDTTVVDYNYLSDADGVTFTMPAQNVKVAFKNTRSATLNTGVILDSLPYVLILGVVAVGAVLLLKRRRDD